MKSPGAWRWPATSAIYVGGALCAIVLGALFSRLGLILAGAGLVTWIAVDFFVTRTVAPAARLHVQSHRAREGDRIRVDVEGGPFRQNHQIRVRMPNAFSLERGATNVWSSSAKPTGFAALARLRGPHDLGPVEIRSWSPARLVMFEAPAGSTEAVEVIPREADISRIDVRSKVLLPMEGRFDVNRPGHGFEFFSLREYLPGDTIRSVNWKASARTEELIVNQRRRETLGDLTLFVDARITSGVGIEGDTPLDRACRMALALYLEAVATRDVVRLVAYGDGVHELKALKGRRTTSEDFLARLLPAGEATLEAAYGDIRARMKRPGPVFILSSCEADPTIARVTRQMVGRGHPVTVLAIAPQGPGWPEASASQRRQWREAGLEGIRRTGAWVVPHENLVYAGEATTPVAPEATL